MLNKSGNQRGRKTQEAHVTALIDWKKCWYWKVVFRMMPQRNVLRNWLLFGFCMEAKRVGGGGLSLCEKEGFKRRLGTFNQIDILAKQTIRISVRRHFKYSTYWSDFTLCLPLLTKNMNHSSWVWLLTSHPVGLCKQPSWAQHWLNIQACSKKGDAWRWQMARCWQWVAARLPAPQFTWRFIKHFGQAHVDRTRSGVIWSPAWGIL